MAKATSMIDANSRFWRTGKITVYLITALVVLFLSFRVAVYTVQVAMERRIRNGIETRLGEHYAILAAHVNGEPGLRINLWKTLGPLVQWEWCPPEPQGSGGYIGRNHHLIYLISDNQWVYVLTWSFRKFTLEPLGGPDLIAAMLPDDRPLYRWQESELQRIDGLRVKNIAEPAGVNFYWHPTMEDDGI